MREEIDHLARAEHRVDATVLQHDAHAECEPAVVGDRMEPEYRDVPAGRAAVALERLDGGGLSRPVRPEHDQHLARLGLEMEAVDRGHRAGRAVAHDEVAHDHGGDRVGRHGVAGYFEQA